MLFAIITTIQRPTSSVYQLVSRLVESNATLIIAGDTKGPADFRPSEDRDWPVIFLSIEHQMSSAYSLANNLPTKHYARKNIAYLEAIRRGATCLYETDDDNAPNSYWETRSELIRDCRVIESSDPRWINVYRSFSDENIWPRGLPLNEIQQDTVESNLLQSEKRAPIQQGLVNGSPDVDAIWRLVMDHEFRFENRSSVYLEPGNWCPFNTQSTWWWPLAFPLLYIPSYCSFRMCDIWKSFVAQRCLWELDLGVTFHAPEVDQDRNYHDLNRDFSDEIPGYEQNRKIAEILDETKLSAREDAVGANLKHCYERLVDAEIFPEKELLLVDAWLSDLASLNS